MNANHKYTTRKVWTRVNNSINPNIEASWTQLLSDIFFSTLKYIAQVETIIIRYLTLVYTTKDIYVSVI